MPNNDCAEIFEHEFVQVALVKKKFSPSARTLILVAHLGASAEIVRHVAVMGASKTQSRLRLFERATRNSSFAGTAGKSSETQAAKYSTALDWTI